MLGAFRQFKTYPLQSLLIALAVALGVAVVTAVVATLNQYNTQLSDDQLWQRQITLQAKADDWSAFYNGGETIPVREVGLLSDEKVSLSLDDLARAKEAAPTVDYAYVTSWNQYNVNQNGDAFDLEVQLVMADYLAAANIELVGGSFPSESDFAEGSKVILLSENLLEAFGIADDPIGQSVTVSDFVGNISYTVVGVVAESQNTYDPSTFVPYTPSPWESDGLRELTFAVKDKADVAQASAELQAYAEQTWGDLITVSSPDDWNSEGLFKMMAVVIAAFASTELAAAALNIVNLMLARVLKRRHSIGILRSLGASRSHSLWQFLSESLLLGAVGGLLGIAAGYGLYMLYNDYQVAFYGEDFTHFISAFPWLALPVGFGLALLCSLLFGFYPAYQASRLRPVEALREV